MLEKPLYFTGLNGLRAIAALVVIVWHSDSYLNGFDLENYGLLQSGLAGYAVNLFFVLSGFLITYLLLAEKRKTGTIDVKKFYMRRILRIWPLYYAGILISFLLMGVGVIPVPDNLGYSIFFYIFLLANVSFAAKITISSITPLWSVGVEEQFYAVWPWIIKKSTNTIKSLLLVMLFYFILKTVCWFYDSNSNLYSFIAHARINLMALGGLGAVVIFKDFKRLKVIIFSKVSQFMTIGVLVSSVLFKPLHVFSFIDNELNSIFYLIFLLNVSCNKKSVINLEGKVFNFFGKISYGLYVYHMIVILLFLKYIEPLNLFSSSKFMGLLLLALIIGLTTVLATLSYSYFEKPILKMKHKFEVIKSSVTKV